ncbi:MULTISPECIES: DUF4375 domain-containing protein [Rhodopseudomonas]|nr:MULTISPECIES: DUF4375 domain-containing protein [Rhodopseudomonas]MDF3809124.1 DUF4375 domain-containing protein [Rhodopseudomonas sp. BAL398]WOK18195.1 DUF4375 domain-containing protein [Rhodopseudomonas sp. BAL398]
MVADPPKQRWQELADFDLTRPDEALALVERFLGEWFNGGLSQLFSNWNGADIVLIPEALRIIGAAEAAPVIEAAIAEFPADQDDWRDLGHDALLNKASPLRPRLWDLDSALASHEAAMTQAVADFELKLSEGEDL